MGGDDCEVDCRFDARLAVSHTQDRRDAISMGGRKVIKVEGQTGGEEVLGWLGGFPRK